MSDDEIRAQFNLPPVGKISLVMEYRLFDENLDGSWTDNGIVAVVVGSKEGMVQKVIASGDNHSEAHYYLN